MVEVKTSELIGSALDWVVWNVERDGFAPKPRAGFILNVPKYSTNWSQGGPLIEKYVSAVSDTDAGCWCHASDRLGEGPTILIAACRAIVAAKLGDTVQVPAELITNG